MVVVSQEDGGLQHVHLSHHDTFPTMVPIIQTGGYRLTFVYLFGNYENLDSIVCKEIILIKNNLLKKEIGKQGTEKGR